jgi:hypothetical protein
VCVNSASTVLRGAGDNRCMVEIMWHRRETRRKRRRQISTYSIGRSRSTLQRKFESVISNNKNAPALKPQNRRVIYGPLSHLEIDTMSQKIAQLVQSPKDKAFIVQLDRNEVGIITGVMNGCCSVVVLWGNFSRKSGYENMRGHHAGGGPDNLNWDKLLDGVPNCPQSRFVMSCAPPDYTGDYNYIIKVDKALKERGFQGKGSAYGFSNAYVNRFGQARPFNEAEEGKSFTIRNKDARFIL